MKPYQTLKIGFHPIGILLVSDEGYVSVDYRYCPFMKTTKTLNILIEICKDGQNGFRDAGENAKHSDLKTLFASYSMQRSRFAGELQQFVTQLGEEPEKTSSIASAIHRGWIDLKAAFTQDSDHAILVECERGEDHAVAAYESALIEDLPINIRSVVSAQSEEVRAAHDDIRDRRDKAEELTH